MYIYTHTCVYIYTRTYMSICICVRTHLTQLSFLTHQVGTWAIEGVLCHPTVITLLYLVGVFYVLTLHCVRGWEARGLLAVLRYARECVGLLQISFFLQVSFVGLLRRSRMMYIGLL